MKKVDVWRIGRIMVFFFFFAFYFSSNWAQSWLRVGTGIEDTGSDCNGIDAITSFNGKLFAGGSYYGYCPTNNIAWLNGNKWDSVASGAKDTSVLVMLPYDSLLFVGGQFSKVEGINANVEGIATWDGSKWDSVGSGLDAVGGVYALCLYNKEIYAGGQIFKSIRGRKIWGIGRWNGSYWDSVGGGMNGPVWALAVFNGDLYVGGSFTSAGNVKASCIARWDGSKWDSVGSGIKSSYVEALAVYNGKLYAGGYFSAAGGIPSSNIACWDGSKWDSVGSGITGISAYVYSLCAYNGNLYSGGYFDSAGRKPAGSIAKWDGVKWSPVGAGFTGGSCSGSTVVWALNVFDSTLYAGGSFTKSDTTTCMGIASWRDSVILGVNDLISSSEEVKVFPNPNSGKFTVEWSGIKEKALIEFYNILGEKIYSSSLNQSSIQIDLSNKPGGIYLYRVITETGALISTGKLIIE